jgi:hypothetical protein
MHTYDVTFTNAAYVPADEEPTNMRITVVSAIEPSDVSDDADVADVIVRLATHMWDVVAAADPMWLWDDVDWTSAEPGWDAVLLHLPDGDVLDLG